MRLRLALGIAALSGFIALSYELVWYRVLSIMTRGVASTFGLLLAAYLFGLAIGSRASGVLCRGPSGDARQLRQLALFVALANTIAALVVPAFAWSARFTDYRLGLAVVAVGAAFLGSVLPLVSHFGIPADDHAGTRLSYVYLANILGSAAGSLLTGFVLMDRLSLLSIARVLVVSGFALSAGLVAMGGLRRTSAVTAYAVLGVAILGAFSLSPRAYDRLYERLIYKNEYDGTQRFAQVVENKSGVITVTEDGTIYGGGGYDGVLNTDLENNDRNGIVRAYIVGAIHPAPREVLMVGLSGGAWAQVVAQLPGVERMTVVEINPGYLDVVAKHPEVKSLLENPKVTLAFDDGRRWLLRHPERRFDVIVMNTTLHWRGHATNLLSSELMEIARRHLLPGGVFYFNTTDSLDVQLTAAHVFPHVLRITNFIAAGDSPFRFDRDRWRWLLETMRVDGRPVLDLTRESGKKVYDDLVGFNDIAPRSAILEYYAKIASDVTDDNMIIEWRQPLRYPELH
jgi:spermidine synthase